MQQRGVVATGQILEGLLEGMELDVSTAIFVADLMPNVSCGWQIACFVFSGF